MAVDLVTLIFYELLKISPELLARYPTVQDKLLYLILIPHIVLFIFLLFFSDMMIRDHPRIKKLIMISAYIYIIFSGFYNTIANIASLWYTILIPVGFFLFIFSFFMPWTKYQKTVNIIGRLATEPLARKKELEILYDELRHLNKILYDELRALDITDIPRSDTYKGGLSQKFREAARKYKEEYGPAAFKEWEKDIRNLLLARERIIKRIEQLEKRGIF